jgi:tetratricopeptide (TPR) repeat protein
MKKLMLFMAVISLTAQAQNQKYLDAMQKVVSTIDTARSLQSYQAAANSFERIANAESKEWLPNYYIAYCNVMISYMDGKKEMIDEYCDKAESYLSKAEAISPDNSEILVLKGMISQARISVNPMSRGRKYGEMAGEYFDKAKSLDPSNPRAYYLKAQGVYYTPSAFGGGKKNALPLFEEAVEKYNAFTPASNIHPNWGKYRALVLLQDCKTE